MPQISRIGHFKGEIKDFGVTTTRKAGLPQFVVTLLATELYDEVTETWDNWAEYEETIIGYFVLVTLDPNSREVIKCLNYDQVMEAVGWDGETYSSLAAMDLKGKRVQFQVMEDSYDGKITLKANWLNAEEAEIGLRKLTGKDLTALDAQFGTVSSKKKKAVAAPAKAKKAPKPKPPKVAEKAKLEVATQPCDAETAYTACVDANAALPAPVPQEVLDDYWLAQTTKIAADTDSVTDDEYGQIRHAVLNDLQIPF